MAEALARPTAGEIRAEFRKLGNPDIAAHSARYFKSARGEYGEGDRFLGIRVPETRKQAKRYRDASMRTIVSLLKSPWHEERLLAVLLLVDRYRRGDEVQKQAVFENYVEHRAFINNWDIVDSSAHKIIGPQLDSGDKELLYQLAASASVWDRRIAIMATAFFIGKDRFDDTLRIAEILLDDKHDLIHKAVGWMLREVGKRDKGAAVRFLRRHYDRMPRTMLRYAIEKFPEAERKAWLRGPI